MSLMPVMVEGEVIVAVRRLVPAVAVKVKLLNVATPEAAFTLSVPVSTAPLAVITICWFEFEPEVIRLPSAS
jgi:hypothetical protein